MRCREKRHGIKQESIGSGCGVMRDPPSYCTSTRYRSEPECPHLARGMHRRCHQQTLYNLSTVFFLSSVGVGAWAAIYTASIRPDSSSAELPRG